VKLLVQNGHPINSFCHGHLYFIESLHGGNGHADIERMPYCNVQGGGFEMCGAVSRGK
jgi:hypothetical protein